MRGAARLLSLATGWHASNGTEAGVSMPHRNRLPPLSGAGADGLPRREAPLGKEERRLLKKKSALDRELYAYAVELFEAQLKFYEHAGGTLPELN